MKIVLRMRNEFWLWLRLLGVNNKIRRSANEPGDIIITSIPKQTQSIVCFSSSNYELVNAFVAVVFFFFRDIFAYYENFQSFQRFFALVNQRQESIIIQLLTYRRCFIVVVAFLFSFTSQWKIPLEIWKRAGKERSVMKL